MSEIFAVTSRGLEQLCAEEMARLPGLEIRQVAYRRVEARLEGDLGALLGLKTVDDVFLDLGAWDAIAPQWIVLTRIKELSGGLELAEALKCISGLRWIGQPPSFSVTANFVGKRNYSSDEIKLAVSEGVAGRYGWRYTSEDLSDLNLRIFIEHDLAYVGLRLSATPQHSRAYKQEHIAGSLKPTVAAAMLQIAEAGPAQKVLDPLCGAGTILIEAALAGGSPWGGDSEGPALLASRANASGAHVALSLYNWDARRLPLGSGSMDRVVTNLPWGRQVQVDEEMAVFYAAVCVEFERVLAESGQIVLLTNLVDLVHFEHLELKSSTPISLFGQQPVILKFGF
jgi:tRNA (guanine6-N2)-methyltransferase